ncbi:MFS family permease [Sphingobium sp. B1D7B]|uniref:MFS transporter n=1 Tax=Sphingobium sp. B1D7B TaxID=2940578 RepID=UPI0022251DEA|nr:MFS transporter [Sphingobium sp. B1D7B]MCW2406863.1 MFS family permease [Sphingobium sp. B1D7B]
MTIKTADRPFYGWKLAAVLWFALAINYALSTYGLSILNVHMGDELQLNRATQGSAFALFMLMTGLPGPLVAKLIDNAGIRTTLVLGNIGLVIGAVAMATIVTTSWMLIMIAGLVIGSANAIAGPITIQASVTRWFYRRRALAMGLVLSGSSIAGMIAAPLLEGVVAETGSWRNGWWLIAALAAIAVVVCWRFVVEAPVDLDQNPDGDASVQDHEAAPVAAAAAARVHLTQEDWLPRDVLRSGVFWALLICSIGVSAAFTIFLAQGVLHMRDLGFSTALAARLISLSVGAGFAAHLMIGFIADRVDPRKIFIAGLVFQGSGMALFAGAKSLALLYPAVAFLGIGAHTSILAIVMVFGNWFGARAAPFVFGFGSAFSAAFGALAPVASGYCYDLTGTFVPVLYVVSALCFMGAGILAFLKPPHLLQPLVAVTEPELTRRGA